MEPKDLRELYREHLVVLTRAALDALEAEKFDGLLVHSGTPRT